MNMHNRDKLMKQLQAYSFAVYDALLYLDAHPDSKCALDYYNKYKKLEAKAMQEYEFDVVVSSDLARSYNTAKCVADLKGMQVEPTPLLREMDWGIYTGQALKEVSWYNLPESVESIQALYDRAKAFIEYLRATYPGKRVFAVGHGAVNRAIETVITGAEPISMVELPIMKNTCWKEFEI